MSSALRQRGLSLTQRAVLCYLCDRMDERRICWPSFDEIAWELGICRRSVISAIKALERLKLLSITRNNRQTSIYRVRSLSEPPRYRHVMGANNAPKQEHPAAPEKGAGDAPVDQTRVQNFTVKGANECTEKVQEMHPESPSTSPIYPPENVVALRAPRRRDPFTLIIDAWVDRICTACPDVSPGKAREVIGWLRKQAGENHVAVDRAIERLEGVRPTGSLYAFFRRVIPQKGLSTYDQIREEGGFTSLLPQISDDPPSTLLEVSL